MSNIIDYVESEMRTIEEKPFTDVDSLVLSQFAYIEFKDVVPGLERGSKPVRIADTYKAEFFNTMFHHVRDTESNRKLLVAMAASPRFRDVLIGYFVNEIDYELEKQFSAMVFFLPGDTVFVCFRGTDSTLVGWKEDFNMAFTAPIPSQAQAKEYLSKVSRFLPNNVMLGGHSKGGNLALFAAMTAAPKLQNRITHIFVHDGPGFKPGTLEQYGFLAIRDRIHKTVPEEAVIGKLLESQCDYTVVKSRRIGILQHDPFAWKIEDGKFRLADEVSGSSEHISRAVSDWLNSTSDEKRELFVDTLYDVIKVGEVESFVDFKRNWQTVLPSVFNQAHNLDPEIKKFVTQTIKDLALFTLKKPKKIKTPFDNIFL